MTHVKLDGGLASCPTCVRPVVYELTGDYLLFSDGSYDATFGTRAVYLPGIVVQDDGGTGIEVGRTISSRTDTSPELVIHPKDLEVGRKVILTDKRNRPVEATLHSIPTIEPPGSPVSAFAHLVLALDAAPSASLETASAVLLGNVIRGSHGETVYNEVAGSGDASRRFQSSRCRSSR